LPVRVLRDLVGSIAKHERYIANVNSFTAARAAMLHVARKSKATYKDFLPFPDDRESSGQKIQARTASILVKLAKAKKLPPRVYAAALDVIGGLLDG